MSVSIVVPVYNALAFARGCIESIYAAQTRLPFEVIVVDNGSTAEVGAWLAGEAARRANFRFVRFEEPLGFPRAANQGARLARHDLLVLLNSDTVVYDGWLDLLASALEGDRAVAAPVTNRFGHDTQMDAAAPALDVALGRAYAASIHHREVVEEPQRLVFFCVMIRRFLWDELSGLDEGYRAGNYDDDDFCLRARLAGYRLALARNVFVFHHERRTFDENGMDHGEMLARNQVLFCGRAVAWSKAVSPRPNKSLREIGDLLVIVPAPHGETQGLRDSLASLANQTLTGFAVLVVSPAELPAVREGWGPHLTAICRPGNLAALLNAGIGEARGRRIAFLPAGDIYYPFHLEVLANATAEAAYTAWSVAAGESRGAPWFDQAAPDRLTAGDWAPLVCWMHAAPPRFDESLDTFCGWDWAMRLKGPQYVRRVTCEKTAAPCSSREAARAMALVPAANPACERERKRFLAAVAGGAWERTLIVEGNRIERRARRMLELQKQRQTQQELAAASTRLLNSVGAAPAEARAAVLLFSIIRWGDLTQRPHHFARGLAARGIPVFWIDVQLKAPELVNGGNLAIEIEPDLHYVELPGTAADLYRLEWQGAVLDAMAAAFAALGVMEAIQLVNFPKWTPLVLRLRERFGWRIVYDCLDDQQAFGGMYSGNAPELEAALIRESEVLVTSGRTLYDRHRVTRADALLIPNAVDFELFANARSSGRLDHLGRPVIGFFGAFSDWLDLEWIAEAARRFPKWQFVYIGREGFASGEARWMWQRAVSAPNIHVIGQVDQRTLAGYLAQFDVCTMPFRDLPITRSMNAVKIFEYLAAGKAVVAPDLPETRPLAERGLIAVYRSHEESFRLLAQAAGSAQGERAQARREFAAENTWSRRLDDLAAALERRRGLAVDIPAGSGSGGS